jgi:hypothetical protein
MPESQKSSEHPLIEGSSVWTKDYPRRYLGLYDRRKTFGGNCRSGFRVNARDLAATMWGWARTVQWNICGPTVKRPTRSL